MTELASLRCAAGLQAPVLTTYLDLTTAEEHVFRKGDFYVIEPGVVYAQKSAPGTEILFIKVPPGNERKRIPDAKARVLIVDQVNRLLGIIFLVAFFRLRTFLLHLSKRFCHVSDHSSQTSRLT